MIDTLLVITNGILVFVEPRTNLIAAGRFYPNGTEAPYVLHHPQPVTNHTLVWMYQSNRYEHLFKQEFGPIDTNTVIKTPLVP